MAKRLNPQAPEFRPVKGSTSSSFCYHVISPPLLQRYFSAQSLLPAYSFPNQQLLYSAASFREIEYPLCSRFHEPEVLVAPKSSDKRGMRRSRNRGFRNRKVNDGSSSEGRQWRESPHSNRQEARRSNKVDNGERHLGAFHKRNQISISRQKHEVIPVKADGDCTTVMIKNIPSKYTRQLLIDFLDDHCLATNQHEMSENSAKDLIISAFDFVYLPIDFNSQMNKGYAFVNFTDPKAVWKFHLATRDQPWPLFQSSKRIAVAYARLKGKQELVKHFEGMLFPCEEYLPICFQPARDGSKMSVNQTTIGRCTGFWETTHTS